MKLDRKQIIKIQKNRDPYLLIDCATKVIPGKYAEGFKILKKNEWFFKVHWPGDPNMPGMLQAEAMVQMSSLSVALTVIHRLTSCFFGVFWADSRDCCRMSFFVLDIMPKVPAGTTPKYIWNIRTTTQQTG